MSLEVSEKLAGKYIKIYCINNISVEGYLVETRLKRNATCTLLIRKLDEKFVNIPDLSKIIIIEEIENPASLVKEVEPQESVVRDADVKDSSKSSHTVQEKTKLQILYKQRQNLERDIISKKLRTHTVTAPSLKSTSAHSMMNDEPELNIEQSEAALAYQGNYGSPNFFKK